MNWTELNECKAKQSKNDFSSRWEWGEWIDESCQCPFIPTVQCSFHVNIFPLHGRIFLVQKKSVENFVLFLSKGASFVAGKHLVFVSHQNLYDIFARLISFLIGLWSKKSSREVVGCSKRRKVFGQTNVFDMFSNCCFSISRQLAAETEGLSTIEIWFEINSTIVSRSVKFSIHRSHL